MERLWECLRRLLRPGWALVIVLSAVSAVCLALIFIRGWKDTLFAYAVYPLSAYCVSALTYGACIVIPRLRQRLHENGHYHRYATDLPISS